MRFVTFSDLLSGPFVTPWQCPYFGTSGTPCDVWPTNQLKLYSTSVIVCFKTSSQIQWYAMLICLVQLVTWSGVSIIQMLEVLYSYNLRFSHVSQTTVNWTSEVFHNRSWPAMNFLSKQVVDFWGPIGRFWPESEHILVPSHQFFACELDLTMFTTIMCHTLWT